MRFRFLGLLLSFLCTSLHVRAQQAGLVASQHTLHWKGYQTIELPNGRKQQVPALLEGGFLPGQLVPFYQFSVKGAVAQGELLNAVYEPLSAADARLLTKATVAATPEIRQVTGTASRQQLTTITLTPLRRSGSGQLEKLVSFTYSYSLGRGAQARAARTAHVYAANSVLNQGQWFKIGVPESGMYKLDKATLSKLGLDVQSLDPRRLQLYGNATGQLPQLNSTPRPDDLVENAIYVSGNGDGSLGDDEYVLFYARGPHTWEAGTATRPFRHLYHSYTDTAYYFLTVGTAAGRRVAPAEAPIATPTATITSYLDRQFHEIDLYNLLKSGRQWLGEAFSGGDQQEFTFSGPDVVAGSPVRVTSLTAAASSINTSFGLTLNGQTIGTQFISRIEGGSFPLVANQALSTFTTTASGTELKVRLAYNSSGDITAKGYLDYLEVVAERQLRLDGAVREFRSRTNVAPGAVSEFVLENAADATVWDVTNPRRPAQRQLTNGRFPAPSDSVREYVAFRGSAFPAPRLFGKVGNQNLHALSQGNQLDLVIVTHPLFLAEAERLAQHRRTHDKLQAQVVTTTQVYNEFSSGGQDISAIRDFMKMVYEADQRTSSTSKLMLLLFGDASYDYKADPTNDVEFEPGYWKSRQVKDAANQNYVPVYESYESFNPINSSALVSFSSDDYFGLLDDNEGEWAEGSGGNFELMDIGVGRLPVRAPQDQPRSTSQARLVVDKLIAYDQTSAYGKWRNRLTLVSDDGDNNLHTLYSAELLADMIQSTEPAYNIHKVYLDMYPQQAVAGGQRSPAAETAIDQSIEQGSLIVNYSGHGGPLAWADEQIFTKSSIEKLQNTNRLTFLLTATCDFSIYDDPSIVSAGEVALTDVAAGAIALLTTTRVVYQHNNQFLSSSFYQAAFPQAGQPLPRLGDVVSQTKNASVSGSYNRNFALLGDPSMRLAYPEYETTIRQINQKAVSQGTTPADTLKAMATVELAGDVSDRSSQLAADFNGTVQITVFDKPTPFTMLGNDSSDGQQTVEVQESVLYDGQATVRNGKFITSFVIPRDINYKVDAGKISLYASSASLGRDAHGANREILIGGVNGEARRDTIPPTIQLFMDNESFVFGGLTSPTTTLLAVLRDSSGINTAGSGIGHEITAIVDNAPTQVLVLNEYYTADVDNFRSGRVRYLFKNLAPGPHVLRLKAWDTFNNSSEQELEFVVVRNEKLALDHLLNYPNPFAASTTFHFDHNRTGEELDVQVQIFTVTGKLIRTLSENLVSSKSHVGSLSWDGRDEFNDQVARGVYLYRVHVRSPRDGSQVSKFEKLVLLR
ncbi:type IX secretion system sortase PorU [Hymenobacter sp. J193]|uniref:type IX secretion system sortase PorU n=1 Tax=Hymenobacter sp. J193 TaxID=2898429 RepID=UPI00215140DF|nr:type IX secretion system sortase PorU [Hymenobacter sp. J193]MCR5887419.1 type IX secretion system sortase PorU [Hymenobacter sp. J193]